MSHNPFEYVKSISETKIYQFDEFGEKEYLPFITTRHFSLFVDTILYANEVNKDIPKLWHHDFLFHSVKARKRFHKWPKKINQEYIETIARHFGYNYRRAEEAIKLLSESQIQAIVELYHDRNARKSD